MNECKSTADIVELMSRIVIVVDAVDVDEGQKRSGQQQQTAKKKENNESGHEQLTAKKICRKNK